MKNIFSITTLILALTMSSATVSHAQQSKSKAQIQWMNWEEVQKALKKEKRPVLTDVYTSWCGWCKKMDRSTFTDERIIHYINDHFYAVKFDAEQKSPIMFKGNEYTYYGSGRRGANRLAVELLRGRLSFPTILYLDGELNTILISPGYKTPPMLQKEMKFVQTGSYKTTSWQNYRGE